MDTRNWWKDCSNNPVKKNFRWEQSSKGFYYEGLGNSKSDKKFFNHFEFHAEISTKDCLFFNMSTYCEKNHLDVWNYVPLTITLDMNDAEFENDIHKFSRIFKSVEAYNNPRVLDA